MSFTHTAWFGIRRLKQISWSWKFSGSLSTLSQSPFNLKMRILKRNSFHRIRISGGTNVIWARLTCAKDVRPLNLISILGVNIPDLEWYEHSMLVKGYPLPLEQLGHLQTFSNIDYLLMNFKVASRTNIQIPSIEVMFSGFLRK